MILLIGVTGYSGTYLFNELVKNYYQGKIRVLIRNIDYKSKFLGSGLDVEVCVGDLNDLDFLSTVLDGVDEILHIASIYYSLNIVKIAAKKKVKRLILVHTTGIYSKFRNASYLYQDIEREISNIGQNAEMNIVILRPTMIFGHEHDYNMFKFIRYVDKMPFLFVIDHGNSLIQPVHGSDLGLAYYLVLINKDIRNGDYILSGEKPITIHDLFLYIAKLMSKKKIFINIPSNIAILLAQVLNYVTFGSKNYIEKVQRMSEDRSFSHALASKDFNYVPGQFYRNLESEFKLYLECQKNL